MTVGQVTLTLLPVVRLLLLAGGARAVADLCPMNASKTVTENVLLDGNRLLVMGSPNISYPPNAYRATPDGNGYVLCQCDGVKPCVRKCCTENMVYFNRKCTERGKTLATSTIHEFSVPKFVNASGTVGAYKADKFKLVYGKLICPEGKYRLEPSKQKTNNFQVSEKGFLLNESGYVIAPPGRFCLEQFSEFDYEIAAVVCSVSLEELDFPGERERRIHMYYTAFAMTLSLPFLFSTFLVYALIRDLRNLHGKSLMCHVATLLVAYSSLILVQFISTKINDEFCVILAYIIQFSFLASFFWLNVMCFDLWWTFSGFRPLRGNLKKNEAKKFIMYSIYAWGSTFLISMTTFYMEYLSNISSEIIRPEFGVNSCWFNTREAVLIYFYGPIGFLLLSNLLMFIYTALMIAKHMREAQNALKGSESSKNIDHERQRFMLYLKLFIVMGVNWSAEIISWALDPNGTGSVWYVTDIGNSLQGVLIFFIFVCKARVLRLLNKKCCPRFSLFKSPTILSTRTTTNSYISRISNNTKNEDIVEMNTNNVQQLTNNKLQDFKV